MDYAAVLVPEHLKLDVARMLDQLLHVHVRTAECLLGLSARRQKRRDELALRANHAHPAPTASLRSLDHQWQPDFGRDALGGGFVGNYSVAPRNYRHSRSRHFGASPIFFPHHADHRGRRPDKRDV